MGTLRDVTGGYTGGLLVLAGSLVIEAILVVSLRLPSESRAAVPDVGIAARERGEVSDLTVSQVSPEQGSRPGSDPI